MALVNALGNIALDASVQEVKTSVDQTQVTLEAIKTLTEQLSALSETLNIFVSQMLRMMPRKDQNDREVVYLESIAQNLTLSNISTVNALGGGPANNLSYSLSIPTTLYDNVKVS